MRWFGTAGSERDTPGLNIEFRVQVRWTPKPAIVIIRGKKDYSRVLLEIFLYAAITRGGSPRYRFSWFMVLCF